MGTGKLHDCVIAFVGGGVMAEGMIKALLRTGEVNPGQLVVSDPRVERREVLQARHGVKVTADNLTAVTEADIVVLAVKPQVMAAEAELGMALSPAFQLIPEQSTAALVVHHPAAKYFNVGIRRIDMLEKALGR